MEIILIFKVGYMSLFIDFLLIFMWPIFHIYIDLKLYLHIPPFINMLIGHIFVLRKELLKEKKNPNVLYTLWYVEVGGINMSPKHKRFWQIGL